MNSAKHHLGTKLRQEMQRLGMLNKDLADHFEMKRPSVTEMLQTGRLAKEKYQKLVDLNGKSLNWWFDIVEPATPASRSVTSEASPSFGMNAVSELYTAPPPAAYLLTESPPFQESELVHLFNALPGAEQQRFMDELRHKAAFYQAALKELIERNHLAASH